MEYVAQEDQTCTKSSVEVTRSTGRRSALYSVELANGHVLTALTGTPH